MSEETTTRWGPSTTIISQRVLGPRGQKGAGVDLSPGSALLGDAPFDHPTHFLGGLAGGPPVSGTYETGNWGIDVVDGVIWLCIVGGTPGTWTRMGANGVETLSVQAAVTQTGITGVVDVTGMAAMAPTVIGTRPQELMIFPSKATLTAGTAPCMGSWTLYEEDASSSIIVAGSVTASITTTAGPQASQNAPALYLRRTAAQLAGKTYRLKFQPVGTGATFTLPAATAIPHKATFKEV